jgi:hypothetical protein
MKKLGAACLILGVLFSTPSFGQKDERTSRSGFIFGFPGSFGSGRGFGGHAGIFPVVPVPRELRTALFLDHFLFRGHRSTGVGPDGLFSRFSRSPHWIFGRPGFGQRGPSQVLYSSRSFVDAWKDRDPGLSSHGRLSDSILLEPGMSEAQVVKRLGTPLQKVQLAGREVWKYSGYSLLFERGSLVEIR